MIEKGYSCIEEFRGKLRSYQKPSRKQQSLKGGNSNSDDGDDDVDVDDNRKGASVSTTIIYVLLSIIIVLISVIVVLCSKLNEYY